MTSELYNLDQIITCHDVEWRVSVVTDTFYIASRAGLKEDELTHSDVIKIDRVKG